MGRVTRKSDQRHPAGDRVAVVQQGVEQEVQVNARPRAGLSAYLHGARVRVLSGMQSAFIDIGGAAPAFPAVPTSGASRRRRRARPNREVARGRADLMVQVVKDPIGTKGGARLSTQDQHRRRLLVYLPQESPHRHLAAY